MAISSQSRSGGGLEAAAITAASSAAEDAPTIALASGHLRPDGLGLFQLAASRKELRQARDAVIRGRQLVLLLLVPRGALKVALLLRQF